MKVSCDHAQAQAIGFHQWVVWTVYIPYTDHYHSGALPLENSPLRSARKERRTNLPQGLLRKYCRYARAVAMWAGELALAPSQASDLKFARRQRVTYLRTRLRLGGSVTDQRPDEHVAV